MDDDAATTTREYCKECGEILVKEPSIYFSRVVNVLCHSCQLWHDRVECESDEEARKICSEYWVLVFKKKPVTTAELKPGRRRRMRKRAADEIKSYE